MLISPITGFIVVFTNLIQARISAKRLTKLFKAVLEAEEEKSKKEFLKEKEGKLKIGEIFIEKADFCWGSEKYRKVFEGDEGKGKAEQEREKMREKLNSLASSASFYRKLDAISFSSVSSKKSNLTHQKKNSRSSIQNSKENSNNEKKKLNYNILEDITIKLPPGGFYGIIGKVGSGKSSLLYGILQQLTTVKGTSLSRGTFAFIAQEAFLINDTFKNNILFGKKFHKKKYKKIIEMCELKEDIETLPGRDETEIGVNGINLSGGQKQRISIARALYSNRDIYIVDDCLSALDAYVGKNILENVFKKFLKGKTVVMVTHNLTFLDDFDKIFLIENGRIAREGKIGEIRDTDEFREYAIEVEEIEKEGREEEEEESVGFLDDDYDDFLDENGGNLNTYNSDNPNIKDKGNELNSLDVPAEGKIEVLQRGDKVNNKKLNILDKDDRDFMNSDISGNSEESSEKTKKLKKKGILMVKETRFTGAVGGKVYKYYFSKGGFCGVFVFVILAILTILLELFGEWWIGQWSFDALGLSLGTYAWIYFGISGLFIVFYLLKSLAYAVFSSKIG